MLREAGAREVVRKPIDRGTHAVDPGFGRVVIASGDGGVGPAAEAEPGAD